MDEVRSCLKYFSTQDSKIVMSGFLEKRGVLNTAWKKRWCLAKDDQVFYYKSKDQKRDKPTGTINLSNAVIKPRYDDVDRENVFDVATKERVYKMAAPSRQELNEWIKALEPSTIVLMENGIIISAENAIKQATAARAQDAEQKYLIEFQKIQQRQCEGSPNSSPAPQSTTVNQTPPKV